MNSTNSQSEREGILSLAALFHDDFSIHWIVELKDMEISHVLLSLEEGVRKNFVDRKGKEFFRFSDLKKQQQLREEFSLKEKEEYLLKITDILLRDLPDDETKAVTLTRYFLHTSGGKNQCDWLMKAGDIHLKNYRAGEALRCFTKILDNLSGLNNEDENRLFIDAAIKYSKVSTAGPENLKVLAVLRDAMARSERLKEERLQALLEMHLAKTEWLSSRYREAVSHFKRGWSIAKRLDDPRLLRAATTFRIIFLFWHGRFREVIQTYEESVRDVDKFPHGEFPLLAGLTVGRCYVHIGHVTQGLGMLDAIQTQCIKNGDRYLASHAKFGIGATLMDTRRLEEAIQYLKESIEQATEECNDWVLILGNLLLAHTYYLSGYSIQSLNCLEEFLHHSRRAQVTVKPYPYLMELCWAMDQGLMRAIPGLSLEKEIEQTINGKNIFTKGAAYRYRALIHRRNGSPHKRVFYSLKQSYKFMKESGHNIGLARTQLEMARQYLFMSDQRKAREWAAKASKILTAFSQTIIPEDLRFLIKEPYYSEEPLKEILKLGQGLVTIRDNRVLVQQIISAVNRITKAERGAIFLINEEVSHDRIKLRASRNLTSEQINHPSFHSSIRMIKQAAVTGKGCIQDMIAEPSFNSNENDVIRSRICVPMILRDKVVGVLYHDNRLLPSVFKKSDLELLSYFAAQAALALDNASAYEEIYRLNQKLKKEKEYYEKEHLQELHFDEIVGQSQAITNVIEQVKIVGNTDTAVLIVGETGVGKELVARATHQHSLRQSQPFIRVHCSDLPEGLVPSELFGHEKGAFTGALHRHTGRFELADGGSIFLDEISEIPLDVQVRLLRVLQSKEFERVGGLGTIHSDFRLIAATNKDLLQEVKKGKFRADLYYRVNVFPIYVPSLRERKEDIPLLASHFQRIYSSKMGKVFGTIRDGEIDKLIGYDWPGNIRELRNVIERAVILSHEPDFRIPELNSQFLGPVALFSRNSELATLEENERQHIFAALGKCGWKVRGRGGAAELLNVNSSTLSFRMKKLGIKRPQKAH